MKKSLGLGALALAGVMAFTGCGSDKVEGTYKFNAIEITVGEETTTYTCTAEEKEDAGIAMMCGHMEGASFELKDGKAISTQAGSEEELEQYYKVEDGKLYMKASEDDEYSEEAVAEIKDGKITIEVEPGTKIVYKKK